MAASCRGRSEESAFSRDGRPRARSVATACHGNSKVNIAPPSGRLRAKSVPPCSLAMRWLTASPKTGAVLLAGDKRLENPIQNRLGNAGTRIGH